MAFWIDFTIHTAHSLKSYILDCFCIGSPSELIFKVSLQLPADPDDDDDDDIGMTPWADRETDKKLANVKLRQTAIDITAEDLVPRLSQNNVADLVLISMVCSFPDSFIFCLPDSFACFLPSADFLKNQLF